MPLRLLALAALAASLAGCGGSPEFGEGFGDGWRPDGVEVLWRAQVGPVTDDQRIGSFEGNLCIANSSGAIHQLDDADGTASVAASLGHTVSSSGPCTGRHVAVATETPKVIVYDMRDGTETWSRPLNGALLGSPILVGRSLMVLGPSGEMLSYSQLTGELLWELNLPPSGFWLDGTYRVAHDDDVVYLGTPEGTLFAIDVIDGFVLWDARLYTKRSPDITANLSLIAGPSLLGGRVCAAAFKGNTACFDAATGQGLWSREISSASTLAAHQERVYLVNDLGALVALDGDTGDEVWRVADVSSSRSPLLVHHGGSLVVENGFAGISVFDPANGDMTGGASLDGEVVDIVGTRGDLVALTAPGHVYALSLP